MSTTEPTKESTTKPTTKPTKEPKKRVVNRRAWKAEYYNVEIRFDALRLAHRELTKENDKLSARVESLEKRITYNNIKATANVTELELHRRYLAVLENFIEK